MFNKNTPKIASLLLSAPFMLDPNFQRSVVLWCEHNDEDGTGGYVLNQPATLRTSDVMSELHDAGFPLFVDGPVAQDSIHYIHIRYDKPHSSPWLGNGIYLGVNCKNMTNMLR